MGPNADTVESSATIETERNFILIEEDETVVVVLLMIDVVDLCGRHWWKRLCWSLQLYSE